MFVSQREYDRLVAENNALKETLHAKMDSITEQINTFIHTRKNIDRENLEYVNECERQRNEAVNAYQTEHRLAEHLQTVVDSLIEQLNAKSSEDSPDETESTELQEAKKRLGQINAELKLIENTPAVVKREFLNRRTSLERLKSEKEQVENRIIKLSDKTTLPPSPQPA